MLKIIPRKLLFQYEYPLRYFYYLLHAGTTYQCNICTKKLSDFVPLDEDRLCPRCGSIQRTRRLWQILNKEFLSDRISILDFSPSRSLYRVLEKGNYFYVSSDLSGDFIAEASYDITRIDTKNESFDLIICYHILEHIEEDSKAMQELFRVLKKGGNCLVQTPFKEGEIYEDDTIKSPVDREKHFGQSDHLRVYSIAGLKNRLEQVGFQVEVRNFNEKPNNKHGFSPSETILICSKPN